MRVAPKKQHTNLHVWLKIDVKKHTTNRIVYTHNSRPNIYLIRVDSWILVVCINGP